MAHMQITLPIPVAEPAVLSLPLPLTPQASLGLEHAVARTLSTLLRDLLVGFGADPEHGALRPDAAEIEYASWMPDPGAIEIASWNVHMRSTAR